MWYNTEEQTILDENVDSTLIQRHSEFVRVQDSKGRVTQMRTVFIPHHQIQSLPKLPIAVVIHGLGGQLTQFDAVIDFLAHFSTVLAIDLPGSGKSEDAHDSSSYSPESLVNYVTQAIEHFCPRKDNKYVLIGHSLGCIHALRLSKLLGSHCVGCVLITPPASKISKSLQTILYWMPGMFFDYVVRWPDKRGGTESPSVRRMVSPNTSSKTVLRRQLAYNLQSRTRTFLGTVSQMRPLSQTEIESCSCPIQIIVARDDQITPPSQGRELEERLKFAQPVVFTEVSLAGHAICLERPEVVNGLIGDFIRNHIDERLSSAWQLSYLASDKHNLKNEKKWRATDPVGDIIEPAGLRGMKTMKQDDTTHSPTTLERDYPDITAVVDISREQPPYEESTFSRIKYHKYATVSKIPPSRAEVQGFIELVSNLPREKGKSIAVHCHYGFNRTGFFIASYLIEKHGFSVKDAIDAFARSRSPGIKHIHFIDELYVRYEL